MLTYPKHDYSHITEWVFLPDPRYRDQCDHVWVMEFDGIDGKYHINEKRCERFAKFQHGDVLLCGLHTPGYGRKGSRKVPRDSDPNAAAKTRAAQRRNTVQLQGE